MRRILVDHARSKIAAKRGSSQTHLAFEDDYHGDASESQAIDVMDLHETLEKLEQKDQEKQK